MALKGQAKRDYQREYMRHYMRRKRGNEDTHYFRIFERDGFRCQYCGRTPRDGVRLQIDHITPRCLGGDNEDDNLITACAECNGAKSGRLLSLEAEEVIRAGLTVKTLKPEYDADGNEIPNY